MKISFSLGCFHCHCLLLLSEAGKKSLPHIAMWRRVWSFASWHSPDRRGSHPLPDHLGPWRKKEGKEELLSTAQYQVSGHCCPKAVPCPWQIPACLELRHLNGRQLMLLACHNLLHPTYCQEKKCPHGGGEWVIFTIIHLPFTPIICILLVKQTSLGRMSCGLSSLHKWLICSHSLVGKALLGITLSFYF